MLLPVFETINYFHYTVQNRKVAMVIIEDYLSKLLHRCLGNGISVLKMNLLFCENRIADQRVCVQVFMVHVYSTNLMIFVGCVVINSFCRVAAGSVDGDFIFSICHFAASSLLIYRAEDMEELADAFGFGFSGGGVHSGKCDFCEAGSRRKISRKSQGTHAAAVGLKF